MVERAKLSELSAVEPSSLRIVRKSDFARLCGLHRSRTSQLIRDGMPAREDGFINVVEALTWCEKHRKITPKKLKAAWASVKKETDCRRAEMVSMEDVLAQAREQAERIRAAALAIPDRVAGKAAKEKDPAKVKALLETEIAKTLNELADILGP